MRVRRTNNRVRVTLALSLVLMVGHGGGTVLMNARAVGTYMCPPAAARVTSSVAPIPEPGYHYRVSNKLPL